MIINPWDHRCNILWDHSLDSTTFYVDQPRNITVSYTPPYTIPQARREQLGFICYAQPQRYIINISAKRGLRSLTINKNITLIPKEKIYVRGFIRIRDNILHNRFFCERVIHGWMPRCRKCYYPRDFLTYDLEGID